MVPGPACSGLYRYSRWSFYIGGPSIQVVLLYRWSFYTGGPSIQVVLLYRWSFYTGGPSIQVVFQTAFTVSVFYCLCIVHNSQCCAQLLMCSPLFPQFVAAWSGVLCLLSISRQVCLLSRNSSMYGCKCNVFA